MIKRICLVVGGVIVVTIFGFAEYGVITEALKPETLGAKALCIAQAACAGLALIAYGVHK